MSSDDTSKLVISKIKQIDDTTLENYNLKNEDEFYLITDDNLPIDVGNKKIVLSANATDEHDVINKGYVDDRLSKSGLLHNIELNSGVEKVNNLNPVNGNINVYNLVKPLDKSIPFLKLINEETYKEIDGIVLSSELSDYVSHVELNQRLPAEFETRLRPYILIDTWNYRNGIKTQIDIDNLNSYIGSVSSTTETCCLTINDDLTEMLSDTSVLLSTELKDTINELSSKSVYLTSDQEIDGNKTFKKLVKYKDVYNNETFVANSTNETLTPKKYVQDLHDDLDTTLNSRITNIETDINNKINKLDNIAVKTINQNQTIYGNKTFVEHVNYENYNYNTFNTESNIKTLVPKGYVVDTHNIITSNIKDLDDYNVKLSGNQLIDGNKTFKQFINYDNKYTDKETFKTETSADTLVPKQFVLDIENLLNDRITELLSTRMARNIGDIFYTTRLDGFKGSNIMLNGAVRCDGTEYNITDTNLFYYFDRKLIAFKTYDEVKRNPSLSSNSFGFFIWDGADRVIVPKLEDVFIQSEIKDYRFNGHYIKPGLPNIEAYGFMGENYPAWNNYGTGALRYTKRNGYGQLGSNGGQDWDNYAGDFNASRCNSIYGSSNTVQPPTIKLVPMVQITNEVQDPAMLSAGTLINQFNNVLSEVNNLLDKLIN